MGPLYSIIRRNLVKRVTTCETCKGSRLRFYIIIGNMTPGESGII